MAAVEVNCHLGARLVPVWAVTPGTWPFHTADLGFFAAWQPGSTEGKAWYRSSYPTSTSLTLAGLLLDRMSGMAPSRLSVEGDLRST